MVPLTSSLVVTLILDVPPHGSSLSTESAMPLPPTSNDVRLDTYRLT